MPEAVHAEQHCGYSPGKKMKTFPTRAAIAASADEPVRPAYQPGMVYRLWQMVHVKELNWLSNDLVPRSKLTGRQAGWCASSYVPEGSQTPRPLPLASRTWAVATVRKS